MPAASVRVANVTPRAFIRASDVQSSAKLADGGSKAAGRPAIGVQTSHNARGVGTCAYWIGRP